MTAVPITVAPPGPGCLHGRRRPECPGCLGEVGVRTPALLVDLAEVAAQVRRMRTALPGVELFYAMKCNPDPQILRTVVGAGCGIEVASLGELRHLQATLPALPPVISANPVKIRSHIRAQHAAGVEWFAFDSPGELTKIAQEAPGARVMARVSVSNRDSVVDLSTKFGMPMADVADAFGQARALGLRPEGLGFHVGSQSRTTEVWTNAVRDSRALLRALEDAGVRVLDIGGGFPVDYTDAMPSLEAIAEAIAPDLAALESAGVAVWAEPGRYLSATAGTLVATVIGVADRHDGAWLYLDAGRFQAFGELFESPQFRYPVLTDRDPHRAHRPYTLTGPTCDSFDTIMSGVLLPEDMAEGDRVYFTRAGAYTHVYGSTFNGFEIPSVVCLPEIGVDD